MRRASVLLLLLAACEPRRNPRNIERALSARTIDVEALDDLLAVEEGSIRLVSPEIAPVCVSPPDDGWFLENVGKRPVWLRRSDLKVQVQLTGFVAVDPSYGGRFGHRSVAAPPRPAFKPEEWFLLERGARLRLPCSAPVFEPGHYLLRVHLPHRGMSLRREAYRFSTGNELLAPSPEPPIDAQAKFLLLPPSDWPGSAWHGTHPIDPSPLGDRRLELYTDIDAEFGTSAAMPLEVFVVKGGNELVHRGTLEVEGHEGWPVPGGDERGTGFFQNRAVYRLPETLVPGEYRILVRAGEAEDYFLQGYHRCDAPRGAASRWIPFRVE